MSLVEKLFGSFSDRELKKVNPITKQVLALEPKYQAMSDPELQAQTPALKEKLAAGSTLDEILPEVLAEVKPYEAQFGHSIPVFVAGGVYTGADLAHFTRLGAAGVQLATRFITTLSLIHI